MKTILTALLCLSLLTLCSCARDSYSVRLETLAGTDAFEPTVFAVVPGQDDIDVSSHDYRRHSQALARVLVEKGFVEARSPEETHITVTLRFGFITQGVPHQGTSLEHLFMLEVEAFDAIAARHGEAKSLWKATATAHGHLDHRHKVFKVLLAAIAPSLGKNVAADVHVLRDPVSGAYEMTTH